ncbi:hypothetical protein C1H46_032425 [Malus baccata]|uniref:Uncharacterized protein n=1 Tax=Malus baccata TaxID=106549 RepID=A0A540L6B6_MALBA|nr:hypothetical protein C1H46_032425 [Malus baccata]
MPLFRSQLGLPGGLLFELLGQSIGNPFVDEDDIPIVLRSWQAQNFLVTVLHIKGPVSSINVLGITEVQELVSTGGYNAPRTVHEVIAHLACRLTRWDDRLFRKSLFGAADEVELKFMNRNVGRLVGGSYRESPAVLREEIQVAFIGVLRRQVQALTLLVLPPRRKVPPSGQRFHHIPIHRRSPIPLYALHTISLRKRKLIGDQEHELGLHETKGARTGPNGRPQRNPLIDDVEAAAIAVVKCSPDEEGDQGREGDHDE